VTSFDNVIRYRDTYPSMSHVHCNIACKSSTFIGSKSGQNAVIVAMPLCRRALPSATRTRRQSGVTTKHHRRKIENHDDQKHSVGRGESKIGGILRPDLGWIWSFAF
jgi:hypothetical protein